jgi:putative transposase
MIVSKSYKFRLEPTPDQQSAFGQFAGCRRFVWNWALERKKAVYQQTGKGIYYKALAAELVQLKQEPDTAFLKECHSQVLQQTLMDLDKAFVCFFEKRARFPKFKSRKRTANAFRLNSASASGSVNVAKLCMTETSTPRSTSWSKD